MAVTIPTPPDLWRQDLTSQRWMLRLEHKSGEHIWIMRIRITIGLQGRISPPPNGNVLFSWAREVVVLDGNTGLILKHSNLPTEAGIDSSTARSAIAPDGTAIIRDQTRPLHAAALFRAPLQPSVQPRVMARYRTLCG